MKYVRITSLLFLLTFFFALSSASAQVVGIVDLTIKIRSQTSSTNNHNKDNYSNQFAVKTTCTDDVSGNEMAIEARTYRVNNGTTSSWKSLPKGTSIQLTETNGNNTVPSTYRLNLRAKNSFITTGSFYGSWNLD